MKNMSSTDTFNVNSSAIFQSAEDEIMIKINQICELTGCSNDAAATALYDSHYNIEVAIDKILENNQKINNDWYEVAKNKKKPIIESSPAEPEVEKESYDKLKSVNKSGRGRGRSRNIRTNRNNDRKSSYKDDGNTDWVNSNGASRGRGGGRRPSYRNRNKSKGKPNGGTSTMNVAKVEAPNKNVKEKWPGCDEWLSDQMKSTEVKEAKRDVSHELSYIMDGALNLNKLNENSTKKQHLTDRSVNQLTEAKSSKINGTTSSSTEKNKLLRSTVETVAKSSSKADIFGDFSRTKPPAPSTFCLLSDPVKLIMSNGGILRSTSKPGFNFTFGFDIKEYSFVKSSEDKMSTGNSFVNSEDSIIHSTKEINTDNSIVISSGLESNKPRLNDLFKKVSSTPTTTELNILEKPNSPSIDNVNQTTMMSEHQHHNLSLDNKETNQNLPLNPILSNNTSAVSTSSIPVVTTSLSDNEIFAPPGMVNQHHLAIATTANLPSSQNAGPYLSMLKIQNDNSIFQHHNIQQQLHHNDLRDGATSNINHINQVPNDNVNSSERNSPNTTSVSTTSSKQQKISNNSGQYLEDESNVSTTVVINNQNTPNLVSLSGNIKHQQVQLDNGEMEKHHQHSASSTSNGVGNNSILLTQPAQHHLSHISPMNIGCFMPQSVLMNSMSNFMSTTANTDLTGVSVHSNVMASSNNQMNKQMFNIPRIPQNHDDYAMSYEEMLQAKHKQQHRTQQNFGSNFPPSKDNVDSINNTPDKMSCKLAASTNTQSSSNQPNTRSGIAQTSSNAIINSQSIAGPGDPRRMQHHQNMTAAAYHHQQQHHHYNPTAVTHPTNSNHPHFNANMYTAASGHHHHHHQHPQQHAGTSSGPISHHQFAAAAAAMVNQAGGHGPHNGITGPPPPSASTMHPAQQIHLMQQQMHNFSQSYQLSNLFQDPHLMSTMVSNSNNRNNLATTASNVMSQQNHLTSNNNKNLPINGTGMPGGMCSQGNNSSGMPSSISNNSQSANPPRSNRNSLWHQTN